MQLSENLSAFRTPCHAATGCGARQRRSPAGGAANGIPLKTRTSGKEPGVPVNWPPAVFTGSEMAEKAGTARAIRAHRQRSDICSRSYTNERIHITADAMHGSLERQP